MHATILAITAELSVLQDRFDLIERALDTRGVLTRADLEAFVLDDEAEAERSVKRDQLVRRLFRDISAVREIEPD